MARVSGNIRLVQTTASSIKRSDLAVHVSAAVSARPRPKLPTTDTTVAAEGVAKPGPTAAPTNTTSAGNAGRAMTKLSTPMSLKEVADLKYATGADAVDFGYSEVVTDTTGNQYGTGFGKAIAAASDE